METKSTIKKSNTFLVIVFIAVIVAVIVSVGIAYILMKPKQEIIQGQVEANVTRISGKLTGRIERFYVSEGESVSKGDTLVAIYSAEALAKRLQVEAMVTAAEAQNQKAEAGTRKQIIQGAYEMWQKAKAGLNIAEKSFDRISNLYDKGVVSAQRKDEMEANLKAMQATEKAARAQYNMAKEGAQIEDKEMARAMVSKADAGLEEIDAYLADSYLIAPIDGVISEIYPKYGELVGPGAPIMSLLNREDMWITFNVREDLLNSLKDGSKISAKLPAMDNKEFDLEVYAIKDLGTYAVWRATKATGSYDAKTFEIKCRPLEGSDGMAAGMSALWYRAL